MGMLGLLLSLAIELSFSATNMLLPDSLEVLRGTSTALDTVSPDTSAAATSSTQLSSLGSTATTTIMDLPDELRIRIYSFAFAVKTDLQEDERGRLYQIGEPGHFLAPSSDHLADPAGGDRRRDLKCFRLPALTQVSAQLRAEALPILFKDSSFVVSVQSNFCGRAQARKGKESSFYRVSGSKFTGVLGMRRGLKRMLHSLKCEAVFRDVTFNVRETIAALRYINEPGYVVVFVRMQFLGQAGLQVTSWDGQWMKYLCGQFERQDVDDTVKAVKDAAESMGSRAHFNGFTIRDLEKLAKVFRFVVPPKVEVMSEEDFEDGFGTVF